MRFTDLAVEVRVTVIEVGQTSPSIVAQVTHPIACFGQPNVDFEKLRSNTQVYQELVSNARLAKHDGLLHLHINGQVELSHTATGSWQEHSFKFTLVVDEICDIFQVL